MGLPGEVTGYRIAVKRLDDGHGGSRAMWQLAVGDPIEVSAPQNHFPLGLQAPATLLVAGGIGITPMVSMAQALVRRGQAVRLLYAARSEAELAYGESLRALLGEMAAQGVAGRVQRIGVDDVEHLGEFGHWAQVRAIQQGVMRQMCGTGQIPAPGIALQILAAKLGSRPGVEDLDLL